MQDKAFIAKQMKNDESLLAFLKVLQVACCKQCARPWNKTRYCHNMGGILPILDECTKLSSRDYKRWLKNVEHGLFHGIMTAYFTYLITPQSSSWWLDEMNRKKNEKRCEPESYQLARRLVGTLFHDIYKVLQQDQHDQKLEEFLPNLPEEFYNHTNPPKEFDDRAFIAADRAELLRYPDYKKWCKPDIQKINHQLFNKADITHFFNHIRPALLRLFQYRNDIWISHYPEPILHKSVVFPPRATITHYPPAHLYQKTIHSAKQPFAIVMSRMNKTLQNSCLMHYSPGFIGLVPAGCFLKHGQVKSCFLPEGRDHHFFTNPIPIRNWLFIYNGQHIKNIEYLPLPKMMILSKDTANMFLSCVEKISACVQMQCVDYSKRLRK